MIYAKIYLDKDADGQEALVFESVPKSKVGYCTVTSFYTAVRSCQSVAISDEARERLRAMLKDRSAFTPKRYSGDIGVAEDYFYFEHYAGKENPKRLTLPLGKPFTLYVEHGWVPETIDYMTPADNDFLRELNMTDSVEEQVLLDRHYKEARARGEVPGCDVESIKRTPYAYMTEEQRTVIQREYHTDCALYDS